MKTIIGLRQEQLDEEGDLEYWIEKMITHSGLSYTYSVVRYRKGEGESAHTNKIGAFEECLKEMLKNTAQSFDDPYFKGIKITDAWSSGCSPYVVKYVKFKGTALDSEPAILEYVLLHLSEIEDIGGELSDAGEIIQEFFREWKKAARSLL